jgi:hypothetical protein
MGTVTVACVLDGNPVLHDQVLRWFASLTLVARVPADELLVVRVDGADSRQLGYLGSAGVGLLDVPSFDARAPHCNKISGMGALRQLDAEGRTALTDCDVACLADPRRFLQSEKALGAKQVDAPNPPVRVLDPLFHVAGLPVPEEIELELSAGQSTRAGNANGGVYVCVPAVLGRLQPAWAERARWLLDKPDLLGRWSGNLDQVAMMLAIGDTGICFEELDLKHNCPTHIPLPERLQPPLALHYHEQVDPSGMLIPTGNDDVDGAVRDVNLAIRQVYRDFVRAAR